MQDDSNERARGLTRGFCELALETRDPRASARFYMDVFGWSWLKGDDDRVWLGCGGRSRLGLWSPGSKEFGDEGGRHVHFAVAIEPGCFDKLLKRLHELGVGHRGPVEHEGGDRSVYFRDEEGNVVEAWDFFERGEGERAGVDALR